MIGHAYNPAGQVVVRESSRPPEDAWIFRHMEDSRCPCERSCARGVTIMCIVCSGPVIRAHVHHTSGDL